jgi:hypothetical protein
MLPNQQSRAFLCSSSDLERAYDGRIDGAQSAASLSYAFDRPPVLVFKLDQKYDDAVKLRMWSNYTSAWFTVSGLTSDFRTLFKLSGSMSESGFTELAVSGVGLKEVSAKRGGGITCPA